MSLFERYGRVVTDKCPGTRRGALHRVNLPGSGGATRTLVRLQLKAEGKGGRSTARVL